MIEVLEARFDLVPRSITTLIQGIDDPSTLKTLLKKAATVDSLDLFKQLLNRVLD